MKQDEAISLLLSNGYKEDKVGYKMYPEDKYFYKRAIGASNCLCNEKPPAFGVTLTSLELNGKVHESMTMKIVGESVNKEWVTTGYYAMAYDALNELSTMEFTILKSWEAFN